MRAEMMDIHAGTMEEQGAEEQGSAGEQEQRQSSSGHSLWVNKYAPRSFMSLLSDEQTNRYVHNNHSLPACISTDAGC